MTPWYFFIQEWLLDHAVIYCSSSVITVSEYCLSTLRSRAAFSKTQKLLFIHNGIVDPSNASLKPSDSLVNIPRPFCLMLATYEIRKGHEHLIKAFRMVVDKCPGTFLLIYGYGSESEQQRIRDQIKENRLDDSVYLCGFTSETPWLIRHAEMVVVPSQAYESFGLTIVEAMALSTPVVVTDTGGMPEVIASSGAGLVCAKEDVCAFANAIVRLLGDPILRGEMGHAGRIAYESKYTASNMAGSYYKKII
jgi:glycosyltransferase involved in cell wall biosynthesis